MNFRLNQCFGSRIRRLSRIVDGHYRKYIKEFGITENQMSILFAMHELGKVEQGKVGELLALERSTVSRNMKLLEKQGYVERTLDYRPEVELTTKGKTLVEELVPAWNRIMDELFELIGNKGIKSIEELEKRIQ